jgi:hypothetical protein
MAQNIYDNDEFFEGYARLPRSAESPIIRGISTGD